MDSEKILFFLPFSPSSLIPFLTHSLNRYSFFTHYIYVALSPFAMRHCPLSALSTNWSINAMLWVTQLERGCQREVERERESDILDEYGWRRSWVEERLWGRRGTVILQEWEGEKMGGQGKSFQLHKWLRAAWQNDEWRGKSKPPSNGLFFFFSSVGLLCIPFYPALTITTFNPIIHSPWRHWQYMEM